MTMTYKELFPKRIPEAVQDDNELREYLEVAGELMDAFVEAIDDFKTYKDYETTAEIRLRDLAREFAMEFPRNLDVETQRTIIRDLKEIYSRTGVYEVINWTFRLIGWDVTLEYAWLPNPENYDPNIADEFNLDDYGQQTYPSEIVDFFRTDYRSFLIGEEYITDHGVYFRGREFFDTEQTIDKLEIVGEVYDEATKVRTPNKVGKTPYVFIRVSDETYNKFLLPYVDPETGEVFTYTELEIFRVVENILNFFVYDEYRPTHVRVVIVVNTQELEDKTSISEYWEAHYIPKPLEMEDDVVMEDLDFSRLDHTIRASDLFMVGTPPSPFGRKMTLAPLQNTKLRVTDNTDPHTRYTTTQGDTGYMVSKPLEQQPEPYCKTDSFTFYTPDREEFEFRRVYFNEDAFLSAHYETGNGSNVDSGTYPDDLGTLAVNFDLTTDTFGIIEALESESIIIREPTDITSPNFQPSTLPGDAYTVGAMEPDESFQPNTLVSFDFINEDYQLDADPKTFVYSYDMEVFAKTAVQEVTWQTLMSNPKQGDMLNLTDWNEVLFVPQKKLGFDFIIDVKYLPQPVWENDPRIQ